MAVISGPGSAIAIATPEELRATIPSEGITVVTTRNPLAPLPEVAGLPNFGVIPPQYRPSALDEAEWPTETGNRLMAFWPGKAIRIERFSTNIAWPAGTFYVDNYRQIWQVSRQNFIQRLKGLRDEVNQGEPPVWSMEARLEALTAMVERAGKNLTAWQQTTQQRVDALVSTVNGHVTSLKATGLDKAKATQLVALRDSFQSGGQLNIAGLGRANWLTDTGSQSALAEALRDYKAGDYVSPKGPSEPGAPNEPPRAANTIRARFQQDDPTKRLTDQQDYNGTPLGYLFERANGQREDLDTTDGVDDQHNKLLNRMGILEGQASGLPLPPPGATGLADDLEGFGRVTLGSPSDRLLSIHGLVKMILGKPLDERRIYHTFQLAPNPAAQWLGGAMIVGGLIVVSVMAPPVGGIILIQVGAGTFTTATLATILAGGTIGAWAGVGIGTWAKPIGQKGWQDVNGRQTFVIFENYTRGSLRWFRDIVKQTITAWQGKPSGFYGEWNPGHQFRPLIKQARRECMDTVRLYVRNAIGHGDAVGGYMSSVLAKRNLLPT